MINKEKIGIINYNCGNVTSLQSSLKMIGYRSRLINKKSEINNFNIIIIPGVGAFPEAMIQINKSGLVDGIMEFAESGKKIIGICLGMHFLADHSYEFKKTKGLGLIKGNVNIHPNGLQVGWMNIERNKNFQYFIKFHKEKFYFNHSYIFECDDENIIFFNKDFGNYYPSIIKSKNIIGIQFHPEKSQVNGLKLLSAIIND